jgi:hypothetical protein
MRTLAHFALTLRNPAWVWLADIFDHLEKPATSCTIQAHSAGSGIDFMNRPLNLDLRPPAELLTYFGPESAVFLRLSQSEPKLTCEA